MMKSFVPALAGVLGVALGANGIYMLVAPDSWYFAVPGVPATGPFNQHFLRDIGLIFLLLSGAFLFGAARRDVRVVFWATATLWLCGHALLHFWEVAVGICAPSVLPRDFPAVTLPALIGLGLTAWAIGQSRTRQLAPA